MQNLLRKWSFNSSASALISFSKSCAVKLWVINQLIFLHKLQLFPFSLIINVFFCVESHKLDFRGGSNYLKHIFSVTVRGFLTTGILCQHFSQNPTKTCAPIIKVKLNFIYTAHNRRLRFWLVCLRFTSADSRGMNLIQTLGRCPCLAQIIW